MKHLFVGYIALCMLVPLYWYKHPGEITLFNTVFQIEWLFRDLLMFAGYGLAACVAFIKDENVRKKVAWAFIIQAAAQIFSKLYDDCSYEPTSLIIQCAALAGSIYYIHKPKK